MAVCRAVCAALVLLLLVLFFLPSGAEGVASAEAGTLYLYGWTVDEDGVARAFFTPAEPAEYYAAIPADISSYVSEDGEFFSVSHYDVGFSAREAADAALANVPEDVEVTEDNLKIVFVYATMNESIKSNGERTEENGVYVHLVTASPDDGTVGFAASLKDAEYGKWYAMLFGITAAALAAGAIGYAVARSRKCRRKKTGSIE